MTDEDRAMLRRIEAKLDTLINALAEEDAPPVARTLDGEQFSTGERNPLDSLG